MSRPESEAKDEHTEHTTHGVQRQLLGTAKGASTRTAAQTQHANQRVAPDLSPCYWARRADRSGFPLPGAPGNQPPDGADVRCQPLVRIPARAETHYHLHGR